MYLVEYVSGLTWNDEIINLNGLNSNNIPVTPTTNAIINVNGSTKNIDSEIVPVELSIHHNDFKNKIIYWLCLHGHICTKGTQTFNGRLHPITELQRFTEVQRL